MEPHPLLIAQVPCEKHWHASAAAVGGRPESGPASGVVLDGSWYPTHGPHTLAPDMVWQVVVPSWQMPWSRLTRGPGQHAAIIPASGHGQPCLFLSAGH